MRCRRRYQEGVEVADGDVVGVERLGHNLGTGDGRMGAVVAKLAVATRKTLRAIPRLLVRAAGSVVGGDFAVRRCVEVAKHVFRYNCWNADSGTGGRSYSGTGGRSGALLPLHTSPVTVLRTSPTRQ